MLLNVLPRRGNGGVLTWNCVLLLRRCTLKYVGMKHHNVCRLLSVALTKMKIICTYIHTHTHTSPKSCFSKNSITCALITVNNYSPSTFKANPTPFLSLRVGGAMCGHETQLRQRAYPHGPEQSEVSFRHLIQTFGASGIATYCAHYCFYGI